MTPKPLLGARNPRSLAEAALGRPIDWTRVADERQFLSDVLATPYEELFDPKYDSPVHLGLTVDAKGQVALERPRFLGDDGRTGAARRASVPATDLDRFPEVDMAGIRRLADLKDLVGGSIDDLPVRSLLASRAGGFTVELGQSPQRRWAELARIFDASVIERLWKDLYLDTGWTPPGGQWADVGSFFHETAEYFDPIQAGLADCWLVSAMSSVAWATPYAISQRTRATGPGDESFVNLIELTDPATGSVLRFELTDQTVVWSGTTTPMYSHSSETGELWPAIVSKAFANWRRGTAVDHPDLTALNYGDCVHASAAITGRKPHYTGTAGSTTASLINLVKANSLNHRTVNPMTAWTYGSGEESPDHVDYNSADIVANHCYSVLGWVRGTQIHRPRLEDRFRLGEFAATQASIAELFARDYIVLRNPWGYHEATSGNLTGTISMRDVSFWRSIDLGTVDGVFAVDVPTFKRYFAGIGVAL
jgi:hypothetical protein